MSKRRRLALAYLIPARPLVPTDRWDCSITPTGGGPLSFRGGSCGGTVTAVMFYTTRSENGFSCSAIVMLDHGM